MQKVRKAEFVPVVTENRVFKYEVRHKINRRYAEWIANRKRRIKTVIQKPLLWASLIDWKKTRGELTTWLVEAAIEGFSANLVTSVLLGMPFTPLTMMAYGFAIKHAIDIYWRLKKNGATSKLSKAND